MSSFSSSTLPSSGSLLGVPFYRFYFVITIDCVCFWTAFVQYTENWAELFISLFLHVTLSVTCVAVWRFFFFVKPKTILKSLFFPVLFFLLFFLLKSACWCRRLRRTFWPAGNKVELLLSHWAGTFHQALRLLIWWVIDLWCIFKCCPTKSSRG